MVAPGRFRKGCGRACDRVSRGIGGRHVDGAAATLIYFPDSTTVPPAGEVIEGARDITLRTSDGLALGAWFVPPNSASDMHGRARRTWERRQPVGAARSGGRAGSRRGLAVVLMDYRGYGGNPGSPSEDGLAKDAMAAALTLEELGYPRSGRSTSVSRWAPAWWPRCKRDVHRREWCCGHRSPNWPTWERTTIHGYPYECC